MMEIPRLINGFEKSMTSSRTNVIVSGATAISALWKNKIFFFYFRDSISISHLTPNIPLW